MQDTNGWFRVQGNHFYNMNNQDVGITAELANKLIEEKEKALSDLNEAMGYLEQYTKILEEHNLIEKKKTPEEMMSEIMTSLQTINTRLDRLENKNVDTAEICGNKSDSKGNEPVREDSQQ